MDFAYCISPPLEPVKKIIKEAENKRQKFAKYKRLVWQVTNAQDLNKLKNYNKRSWEGYHLDHKISIWDGFQNGISAFIIGSLDNLQMIPREENMKKGRLSYSSLDAS